MDKAFILSLFSPFFLGLLAGSTTCSCLIGGLLVSISKSWTGFKSHLLFNLSRLIAFSLLGFLFGLIGNFFYSLSSFFPILITLISLFMIYLALPMVGVKIPEVSFFKFKKNYQHSPFLSGVLTVLIPCGFTLTAESLAIISASPIKGLLIMSSFILGTIPSLLLIGFFSFKLFTSSYFSKIFSFIAGFLIISFSLYTLKTQFLPSSKVFADETQVTNGKQIIKMTVLNSSYQPNYFEVKTHTPIIWEITNKSVSGCTSGVIVSKLFFNQPIQLASHQLVTKEFTIDNPGTYRFSCSMGMVSGTIKATN